MQKSLAFDMAGMNDEMMVEWNTWNALSSFNCTLHCNAFNNQSSCAQSQKHESPSKNVLFLLNLRGRKIAICLKNVHGKFFQFNSKLFDMYLNE